MNSTENQIHDSRTLLLQNQFSRGVRQIGSTVKFEFIRNKWNLVIACAASLFVYLLFLIINIIQEARGADEPTQIGYITGFLMLIGFLVIVLSVIFAGSIIAEDFQKDTGNLIFPNTTRERLLTGRIIARYFMTAISVTVFYTLIGITTAIKYGSLVPEFWVSWGWTLLYTFLIFSCVTLFSSFLKSTTATIIISLLLLLIVFNLLTTILTMTGFDIEPLFVITYYSNIITECFDMPTDRFVEQSLRPGGGPDGPTIFRWITPNVLGGVIGMLVYSTTLITISYIIFRYRQKK